MNTVQITFGMDDDDDGDGSEILAQTSLSIAQGLVVTYIADLAAVTGDRDAVTAIRERIRNDMSFIEHSPTIVEVVGDSMNWTHALLRAEAKRATRAYEGRMEELRQKRLAEAEAAKRAEQEHLQSLTNFGMF